MKKRIVVAALAAGLTALGAAKVSRQLTVKAIGHDVKEISTGSHTNCTTNPNPNGGANTGCHSRDTAIYVVRQTVVSEGTRYIIGCTVRFIWQNCPVLDDGDQFDAEIKGGDMIVAGRAGGNQGKLKRHKYHIFDIRPMPK